MAKKARRGHPARTEITSIRLEPRTKYLLEVIARKQHRTLSEVIHWSLTRSLGDEHEGVPSLGAGRNLRQAMDALWSPHEPDRLVRLGQSCPELLDYNEDLVWTYIKGVRRYWRPKKDAPVATIAKALQGEVELEPNLELIREEWEQIKEAASRRGE
jgi:hypothetical protein